MDKLLTNQELEKEIKKLVKIDNLFDFIMAAQNFEPCYKNSVFYKQTKIPLNKILKDARIYYTCNVDAITNMIQNIINGLDVTKLQNIVEELGQTFSDENEEVEDQLASLEDFRDLINQYKKPASKQ